MPEVTFGSWKHSKSPRLRFSSPHKTYSADELDQVIPLSRAAETAAKSGAWVALMLSYEAAPAFDDALTTHNATVLPLAWAAVFDQPDDEATLTLLPKVPSNQSRRGKHKYPGLNTVKRWKEFAA